MSFTVGQPVLWLGDPVTLLALPDPEGEAPECYCVELPNGDWWYVRETDLEVLA